MHGAVTRRHGNGNGHRTPSRASSGYPGDGEGELSSRVGGEGGLNEGAQGIYDVAKYLGRVFLHIIALTEQPERVHKNSNDTRAIIDASLGFCFCSSQNINPTHVQVNPI